MGGTDIPNNRIRNQTKDVVENHKDFYLSEWPLILDCTGDDLKEKRLLFFKVKSYRRKNLN